MVGSRRPVDGARVLASVDVDRGAEKVIGTSDLPAHAPVGCYSLAPNGKAFAVSVARPRSDIWLLKGFV